MRQQSSKTNPPVPILRDTSRQIQLAPVAGRGYDGLWMSLESLKVIAGILVAVVAILGSLYGIVTVPLLRVLKAEMGALRAEIAASESRLEIKITALESRLEIKITALESRLEKQMIEMETRLNQRIDTRLVHR
jgi:hypothetical protein